MKKHSAILLSVTLLLCSMLFGCGTDAIQEMPLPEGLVYRRINNNTEYEIFADDSLGYMKLDVERIVFPSYHNGLPVTRLDARFNNKVKEIVLPKELKDLERCYLSMTRITRLEVPAACTMLPESLCFYCQNLEEVQLLGAPTRIMRRAFIDCPNLQKINLDGVTQIGESAFENTSLRHVAIPASVVWIASDAFLHSALTAIVPKTVTIIGQSAFAFADIYTDAVGKQAGWAKDPDEWLYLDHNFIKSDAWFGTGSHVFRGCTFRYDGDTPYVYSMPNRLLNYFDGEFTNEEGKAEEEFVPARAFSVPFRAGYTFKGWSLEEGSSEVEFGVTMFDPTTVPELQEAAGRNKFMQEPYLCSLSTVGDWLRFTPDQTLYAVWEKE